MDSATQLFLDSLADLRKKSTGTSYELLRASAILRQLFLDQEPLVHRVNRLFRVRVEFETIDTTLRPPIRPEIEWQNLDASMFPRAQTQRLSLKELLAAQLLSFKGAEYTVRDVIRAAAHVKGGVHARSPLNEHESNLLDLDKALKLDGIGASTAALRGIIQVTLRGLAPLEQAASQRADAADRPVAGR